MPKIVLLKKEVVKGISLVNFLAGGKSTKTVELWEGDEVTDFAYFNSDEEKIEKVSGVLRNVNLSYKNNAKPQNGKYTILDMASVVSVNIDASEVHKSNIVPITKKSILEYQADAACDDADLFPMIKLKVNLLLSDNTTKDIEIMEGDVFTGAIYRTTPAPAIVYGNFTVEGFVYTASGDITGLVLNNGSSIVNVPLADIKSFGTEAELIADVEEAADKINQSASQPGETSVAFEVPGSVDDALTVGNKINVRGVMVNTPANVGPRATDAIDDETENVFKGKVTINEDAEVSLDGVTLTDASLISGKDVKAISLLNSKVAAINPDKQKSYFVHVTTDNIEAPKPIDVRVEGCYFGKNIQSTNKIHNLFEINDALTDGSTFKDLTFNGSADNNNITIYNAVDGAHINIENCHIDDANCFSRVGLVGAPKDVVITYKDITYDNCEKEEIGSQTEFWGICTIEPYATKTTDLSGVTIYFENFKPHADEKPYLVVLGPKDAQLADDKLPTVYINGVKETALKKITVSG